MAINTCNSNTGVGNQEKNSRLYNSKLSSPFSSWPAKFRCEIVLLERQSNRRIKVNRAEPSKSFNLKLKAEAWKENPKKSGGVRDFLPEESS